MKHHRIAADHRSASEIVAEARTLQARHAPRVFARLAGRFRAAFVVQDGKTLTAGGRQITVH